MSNKNNKSECTQSYYPRFLGTIPKGEKPKRFQIVNPSTNKTIADIKCPMCSNKCFYPLLEYHRTYANNGNSSKATAVGKTVLKTMFIPKLGRISKCLSCTKCGYMNIFREFSIIKPKK